MKKISFLFVALFWGGTILAQNVGIGTPTPDHTLDINGSLGINDNIYHNDDPDTWMGFPAPDTWELGVGGKRAIEADGVNSTLTVNPDGDDIDFLIRSDGINALLYADTNNDHIGIGHQNPQHLVDIDNGNMLIRGDGINALMYADHEDSSGFTNPPHIFITIYDIDNLGDEGKVSYSNSVYNVTNTSARIRLEEPDFGPMFGDIIIYWMAIE